MLEWGDVDLQTHQNSRFDVLIFRAFCQDIISDVGYDEWNGQFYQTFDDGAHLQCCYYERKGYRDRLAPTFSPSRVISTWNGSKATLRSVKRTKRRIGEDALIPKRIKGKKCSRN